MGTLLGQALVEGSLQRSEHGYEADVVYRVVADLTGSLDALVDAMEHTEGIPQQGDDLYGAGAATGIYCASANAEHAGDGKLVNVTVTFRTPQSFGSADDFLTALAASTQPNNGTFDSRDRTQWLPVVDFNDQHYEKYIDRDRNGDLIRDKVGLPITNPPIKVEDSIDILNVSFYVKNVIVREFKRQWKHKVNSSPIWGYEEKKVYCSSVTGNIKFYSGSTTPLAHFNMMFKIKNTDDPDDIWQPRPPSASLLHKETPSSDPTPISVGGRLVTEPWPHDANGKKLADGYLPSEVQYIEVEHYGEVDFSALPFDLSSRFAGYF